MKKILFDTYVVSLMLSGNLPDNWIKYYNEIRKGERILLLRQTSEKCRFVLPEDNTMVASEKNSVDCYVA